MTAVTHEIRLMITSMVIHISAVCLSLVDHNIFASHIGAHLPVRLIVIYLSEKAKVVHPPIFKI